MTTFFHSIDQQIDKTNSLLCVGLDPDLNRIPQILHNDPDPILSFNKAIIDATADLACCFKPQMAYYSAASAEDSLAASIAYAQDKKVPVILDFKRGDIGSTADQYVLEAFTRFNADAVTVNPYMGRDSLQPFLDCKDKGVFILCRTSNPGGSDLQNLALENGDKVYQHVAKLAVSEWNANNNVGLVVGATRPEELAQIRTITGAMPFLCPGVGAQGADIGDLMKNGQGGSMLINSSRAILYASEKSDFATAARDEALRTRDAINAHR